MRDLWPFAALALGAALVREVRLRRRAEERTGRIVDGADPELRDLAIMAVATSDAVCERAQQLGLVGVNGRGSSA